jgi:hypothetical protein
MSMSRVPGKQWFVFSTAALVVFSLMLNCGDDKKSSPTGGNSEVTPIPITVVFNGDSTVVDIAKLPVVKVDGLDAVCMTGLVDTSKVKQPTNYGYRVEGVDGFCAHSKGSPDNTYSQLAKGNVILSSVEARFDVSLGLFKRYNVVNFARMEIIRKLDFVTAADSLTQFSLDDLTKAALNGKEAVKLTDIVPSKLVPNPEAYSYTMFGSDGYNKTATYDQFVHAYFVIPDDKVTADNSGSGMNMGVKWLNKVVAVEP